VRSLVLGSTERTSMSRQQPSVLLQGPRRQVNGADFVSLPISINEDPSLNPLREGLSG
jgi:hypothetical protein